MSRLDSQTAPSARGRPVASLRVLDEPSVAGQFSPSLVLSALRSEISEIQQRSVELDRTGSFPIEDVKRLASLGALEVFASDVPTPMELFEALRLVGRANLSLGRIFEGHVNGAKLVALYGSAAQRRTLTTDLTGGKLFGVWNTEPAPGVALSEEGYLTGRKSFATGAGYVNCAIITASTALGGQMVLVNGAIAERADPSVWHVRGMKATQSGLYDLTGMPVDSSMLVGSAGDYVTEPTFTAGAWRFTAVQLGGIERVISLVREHHLKQSSVDAVQAARFGHALADVRSAYLWVREAAVRSEHSSCGAAEIAFVLMTRGVVERAGLRVIELAARSVGTQAFFTANPLDQACRDLSLYLRQPSPDQALDRAARAFIETDCWAGDPLW